MRDLLKDHIVWLVITLALLLTAVLVLSLSPANATIIERLISGGVLVTLGGIINLASNKRPD